MKLTKKNIFIFLVFLFSVSAVLYPILLGDKIVLQIWATDESYPFNAYFDNHFDEHLPLWFASHAQGFPAYLTQSGGFLHPVILLFFKITDYLTAYHFLMFFNLLVSCLATYLLARRVGMSRKAGIISGSVFAFSQMSIFTHAISLLGGMLVFLPILMLCVLEIYLIKTQSPPKYKSKLINWFARRKRFWLIILTSILLTIAWLTSYTEGILYVVITCFFFALFLDTSFYLKNKKNISFGKCFNTTSAMAIIVFLSGLLASPWMLPVLNFIKETRRGLPTGITMSSILSNIGWNTEFQLDEIIRVFHPYFFVPYAEYIPLVDDSVLSGYTYVGVLPLLLGILSFFSFRKNKINLFFILFFVFTLLTYLPYIPLNGLMHKLPVFNLFRDYYKWIYIMIFCWAMLAGFGFDAIKDTYKTKRFKQVLKVFEFIFFSIFGLSIVANIVFIFFKDKIISFGQGFFNARMMANTGLKDAAATVELDYVHNLIRETVDVTKWNISFLNPHFFWAMFFIFMSALIILAFRKGWLPLSKFKTLAVVLVILNFTLLWQGFYKTAPTELIMEPPATVEFLNSVKKEKEPFRVTKFPNFSRYNLDWELGISDYTSRFEIDLVLLTPDYGLLYDIDTIYGGDGFMPLRHERMTSYTIGGLSSDVKTELAHQGLGYKMSIEDRIQILNTPFSRNILSMMNVKYLLTTFDLPAPWKLVFETTATKNEIPVYIYENPDAMHRIYFAKNVKIVPTGIDTAFDELIEIEDFKETTLIECDNTLCSTAETKNISLRDNLQIEKIDFDYLQLKTKTKTPRWLVYSQSNFPTWEVRIDGELADVYTANYIYQGIFVPAGEHEIEFKYPGFMKQFYYSLKSLADKLTNL